MEKGNIMAQQSTSSETDSNSNMQQQHKDRDDSPDSLKRHPDDILPSSHDEIEEERKAVVKMDLICVPSMVMFYFLSFLDRTNIGNAAIEGLQSSLKLTDWDYRFALTILYIPYILGEIPANLVLSHIGARVWLSSLVFVWGIIATLQGIVKNKAGLWANRFFLGLCEAGILPGIMFFFSLGYKREEIQLRIGYFWAASSLAGSIGGFLAAAISKMDGKGGLRGWSWIFIIEGIFTTICGLIGYIVVPKSPTESRFLTLREKHILRARLQTTKLDDPETNSEFSWKSAFSAYKTSHFYLLAIIGFCQGTMIYSMAYFLPTIISTFGYSTVNTQLLTVPPYFLSFILSLVFCKLSDKYCIRGPFLAGPNLLTLAGLLMFYCSMKLSVRYVAVFLLVVGVYSGTPAYLAWASNSFSQKHERAVALASMIVMTNSGGILSTWLFRTADKPKYVTGTVVNLSICCVNIAMIVLLSFMLYYRNKTRQPGSFKYIL